MKVLNDLETTQVHGGEASPSGAGTAAFGGIAAGLAVAGAAGPLGVAIGTLGAIGAGLGAIGNTPSSAPSAPATCAPDTTPMGDQIGTVSCTPGPTSQNDSDGGGGGGGKVICTELCRNGIIEHDVWMADIRYSRENFSEQTMRGYHLWGIPYVKLMRKSPLFTKIAAYPTTWFAEDIAYRMGVRAKPNLKGWVLREILFRPICSVIGVFAKARDWQALWRNEGTQAARS